MDFGDQPSQPKQIPWKLIFIVGGGIVLAGVILAVVLWQVNRASAPDSSSSSPTSLFGKPVTTTYDACASAEDKEACRIANAKQKAIEDKKADVCESLKEADKDDCYWSVARVARDAAVCTKITDKNLSVRCSDELSVSAALATSDILLCDKIGDGQVKASCQLVITSTKGFVCAADMDCEFDRVLSAANQAEDAEVCRVLDPKRDAECRAQILVNDPDHDGLDSTQELVLYGTDPRNKDTDGDGYLDGEEVNSGHDPLKK